MGAWGTGLFSSDLACDVRDEYRELLGDEVADDEAEARIIAEYSDLDVDEAPEFWIVLAMVQFKVGRLSDGVRERAARFIADGADLPRWEESGVKMVERRRAVLAKVAEQIAGEQPVRRKIRREWRHETDLETGDVLEYTSGRGRVALFRVVGISESCGRSPLVQRLDFAGSVIPGLLEIESIANRPHSAQSRHRYAATLVSKYAKRDSDWFDVGFRRLGRTGGRADDDKFFYYWGLTWDRLSEKLEAVLTEAANGNEFVLY